MSSFTLTWEQFLKEAVEFKNISDRLGDTWILYKKVLFMKFYTSIQIKLKVLYIMQNEQEGNAYLIYEQKIVNTVDQTNSIDPLEETDDCIEYEIAAMPSSNDLLKIEYHIVYSISYQVPVLYFRAYRNGWYHTNDRSVYNYIK